MKYHILTSALIGTAALWGMEPEVQQPSTKLQGRLAHINFNDKAKAFELLTHNKASLLKILLAEEQRGIYCPDLYIAEKFICRVMSPTSSNPVDAIRGEITHPYTNLSEKTQYFVGRIMRKSHCYEHMIYLFDKNAQANLEYESSASIEQNPSVVNAYGSPSAYPDRKLPLLHYVLEQTTDGIFTKAIGKQIGTFLLSHGANVNAHDDAGNTPLHHAPTPGFITLLCLKGANPSETGDLGRTPLLNHIRLQNWSIVKKLLPYCNTDTMNKADEEGNTPLEEAVRQGNKEIVQLLLDNGADWTFCCGFGNTLDDETTNPEIRLFMIDHIEKSIRLFLRDDNHKAMKRTGRRNGIYCVIDHDKLVQWAFDNLCSAIKDDIRRKATNWTVNNFLMGTWCDGLLNNGFAD